MNKAMMSDAGIVVGVALGIVDALLVRIEFVSMVWTVGRYDAGTDFKTKARKPTLPTGEPMVAS
jgi:hypothetical protein